MPGCAADPQGRFLLDQSDRNRRGLLDHRNFRGAVYGSAREPDDWPAKGHIYPAWTQLPRGGGPRPRRRATRRGGQIIHQLLHDLTLDDCRKTYLRACDFAAWNHSSRHAIRELHWWSGHRLLPKLITFPEAIRITTSLIPGTQIGTKSPLTITWTGGTADMQVRTRMGTTYGRVGNFYYERWTTADQGKITLYPTTSGGITLFPNTGGGPGDRFSITVLLIPLAQIPMFSLPGFDDPISQKWMYVFSFTDLVWK